MKCKDGMVCSKILINCLRTSDGCHPRGICVPANSNGQPQIDRPSRETPSEDPCATMKCSDGSECTVVMPSCMQGAKDCRPTGVCVPRKPPTQVASMPPPVRDDPIQEIPNNCKFIFFAN